MPTATSTPSPTASPTAGSADVTVSIDRARPVGVSQLSTGVTHTLHDADPWNDAAAVASAWQLLRSVADFQNQPMMGAGPDNPWPNPAVGDPARWNWASLDARIDLISKTGGTPVITFWGAPTWMVDPNWAGGTDWSKIDWAPLPWHEADFAYLCQQVALRYPDVKHFQVWAELKGMHGLSLNGSGQNRWDYERYTRLYNLVWDYVKAVRPDGLIGGPYVYIDSRPAGAAAFPSRLTGPFGTVDQRALDVLAYWLANKHGTDFITVDGGSYDNTASDPFGATQKFADVTTWIKQQPGAAGLPVWWGEWYVTPWNITGVEPFDHHLQNALMTMALANMARSGAANAMKWQAQGVATDGYAGNQGSFWSDTRNAGGGQPFPFYRSAKAFHDHFGAGRALYQATSSSPDVEVLASATTILLVNKRATLLKVSVNGTVVTMAGHEVRVL